MKTKTFILLTAWMFLGTTGARAMDTSFTYSGHLNNAKGQAAAGPHDFKFTVFDAATGGTAVGGPVETNDVPLKSGAFTVTLDFGEGVFTGAKRWLEVAVRASGGGAYDVQSPRPDFTAIPYAQKAASADTAGRADRATLADGVPQGAITTSMLASNSVGSGQIANGAVGSGQVASGAIATDKMADGAVTAEKVLKAPSSAGIINSPEPGPKKFGFGRSVAAFGLDMVLISAPAVSSESQAVYLFHTNGTLITTFHNPTPEGGKQESFGKSQLTLNGGLAAVGSDKVIIGDPLDQSLGPVFAGAAYLFNTNGTLLTTFTDPNPLKDSLFGDSVTAVGYDKVLIGAPMQGPRGSTRPPRAYLFRTDGTLLTTFYSPFPPADNGYVAFADRVAAVGSDQVLIYSGGALENNSRNGAVLLFDLNGNLLMTFSNPLHTWDGFGYSMAPMGSDKVIIGTVGSDLWAGKAYLFRTDGTLLATFRNPNPPQQVNDFDGFGTSLAAVGLDKVLIGDPAANNATDGRAYLFRSDGTLLSTVSSPAPEANDGFGESVAGLGADMLVVGASGRPAMVYLFSLDLYVPGLVADGVRAGSVSQRSLADHAVTADKVAFGGIDRPNLSDAVVSNTFWNLVGNANTTPGTHFLGTTDPQPLEFRVNGQRALRIEPNGTATPNLIGGFFGNFVGPAVVGATIGGGGDPIGPNAISADWGTIAGGRGNSAAPSAVYATIGGGNGNTVQSNAWLATISGGLNNTIQTNSRLCTISGGGENAIQNDVWRATISGGVYNTIQGGANDGAIGGGFRNTIQNNGQEDTIGGGADNMIQTNVWLATIGGGGGNTIQANASYGAIGGGGNNTIQRHTLYGAIGGGLGNTNTGDYAAVPGGDQNLAGTNSLAAGHRAKAADRGSFVWADSTDADFATTASNQFLIRAGGGVGIGTNHPQAQLHVRGLVMADQFQGVFAGDGSGLINLPLANPANVAFLNSNQTFTASNIFAGVVTALNASNQFAGSFSGTHAGSGAGLMALNPANLGAGTANINISGNAATATTALSAGSATTAGNFTGSLAGDVMGTQSATTVGRIRGVPVSPNGPAANQSLRYDGASWTPASVALGTDVSGLLPIASGGTGAGVASLALSNLGAASLTVSNIFSGVNAMTNVANTFVGAFAGNGAGLSNVLANLPANVAYLNSNQLFITSNLFAGVVTASNTLNRFGGTFNGTVAGEGSGMTNLNADRLASGSVPDARLSNNVARLNLNQTFSGTQNFAPAAGAPFTVANSTKVTSLNADLLDGLDSTAFAQLNSSPTFTGNLAASTVTASGLLVGAGLQVGSSQGLAASFASIAGGELNTNGALWGSLGGGRRNLLESADYGVIGGGVLNTIQAGASSTVVAGGLGNVIGSNAATAVLVGGNQNRIRRDSIASAVVGGFVNQIETNAPYSFIGGGSYNTILPSAQYATIPGGSGNSAAGNYSFAAGHGAQAAHPGAFVWADSSGLGMTSTSSNQFLVRATGGVGIGTASPQAQLHVIGTNKADIFVGKFLGDGAGLSNVTTAAALPANVALLDTNQIFTGANTFSQGLSINGNLWLQGALNMRTDLTLTQPVPGLEGAQMMLGDAGVVSPTGSSAWVMDNYGASPNASLRFFRDHTPGLTLTTNELIYGNGTLYADGVNHYVGIGTTTPQDALLDVEGDVRINDHDLFLRAGFDRNHGLSWRLNVAGLFVDGPFLYGFDGGALGATGPDMVSLLWDWMGNVWVSNNLSTGTLTVRGGATMTGPVAASGFSGNGAGLTSVNADLLDGLDSTAFWKLTGNAGTTPGTHFLGTTDNQPLELKVNNSRALRLEPGAASPNVIGGADGNSVSAGLSGATIAGGGRATIGPFNTVAASYGAIGGGSGNYAAGLASSIAGGSMNTNVGNYAAIGGGRMNAASNDSATVGGGSNNLASGVWSVVGGGAGNRVSGNGSAVGGGLQNTNTADAATISGGAANQASVGLSAIGGGGYNSASGPASTVSGGYLNNNSGLFATVGGGATNTITSAYGTIGGGSLNSLSSGGTGNSIGGGSGNNVSKYYCSAIAGGQGNFIQGSYAEIPGGQSNSVTMDYGFAAGRRAKSLHTGAFVWADSRPADFPSTNDNSFNVRATGGARFVTSLDGSGNPNGGVMLYNGAGTWSSLSDRQSKENLQPVNSREVLDRLAGLSLSTWNYKSQDASIRHLGPMAQDFAAAFHMGEDERHISTVDADGVALAAIQGLNQKLEERSQELEARSRKLEAENADLKARLEKIEQLLGSMNGPGK